MSSHIEPDFSAETIHFEFLKKLSISDFDKKSDTEETEKFSAGIFTPSETTAESDDELDKPKLDKPKLDETVSTPSTTDPPTASPTRSWWKGTDPTAALFTPIQPPDDKFKPLWLASLPNSYHPNAITAVNERPVSFDVAVHAAYRVSEATIHAVNAAESVATWAKTREPPYTTIPNLSVQELLKAIPAAANTVRIARRALLYAVKPVANLGPLWEPEVYSNPLDKTESAISKDDMADAWWNVSDETQHMHDAAASSIRTLHKTTNTGRTGWRKETQKIVENLDIVQDHAVVAKQTWSDFLSGGQDPDFAETSLRAKKAVQRSAVAIQQLLLLADAISSEVSRHRFWQWSTWMKSEEEISPADEAAYLLAKREAKKALNKAKSAVAQAMVAAKATDDYK